jgi:hypothetical protein
VLVHISHKYRVVVLCKSLRRTSAHSRKSPGVAMPLTGATQGLRWRSDPVGCERLQTARPA